MRYLCYSVSASVCLYLCLCACVRARGRAHRVPKSVAGAMLESSMQEQAAVLRTNRTRAREAEATAQTMRGMLGLPSQE